MAAEGFFSKIQSFFKEGYDGRYIAIVLGELIREEPKLADYVFNRTGLSREVRSGRCTVGVDNYLFKCEDRKRRADLALVSTETGKAIALLEIKCRDFKSSRNKKHFEDYIAIAQETACAFRILTQYVLPQRVHRARVILMAELATAIAQNPRLNCNPLVRMFIDYVREKNLMFNHKLDMHHVRILLALLFNKREAQGTISKPVHVETNVPRTFKSLIDNTSVVLQHVSPDIAVPERRFTRSINFYLSPYVKLQGSVEAGERQLKDREKNGGSFWTYGCFPIAMAPKPWNANLESGIVYSVEGQARSLGALTIQAYAILNANAGKLRFERYIDVPQKKYCEQGLIKAVLQAIRDVIADAESSSDPLNRQGSKAVRDLMSRLREDLRLAA